MKTEITLELLLPFCGEDDEHMGKPLLISGDTYATDGRIVIRATGAIAGAVTDAKVPKNIAAAAVSANVMPGPEWIDLPELAKGQGGLQTCRFCGGKPAQECTACDNSGMVKWEFLHGRQQYEMEFTCPVCDGEGREECDQCCGSGKEWDCSAIDVGPCKIAAHYVRKLSALPGVQIAPRDRSSVVAVRFEGGTGGVMPMREVVG